ncbi:hypothetical protein Vadar_027980 [Vaccinium darrowii]|uniref:Uncharacterized protein n=1 Tax=Vaccinium darrowii TaxID=229202 RepID=A0ACB7XUF3_9ERIC|nr:hypothetical protein Vadar_027980 [Vaccinium darrowii]
MKAKSNLINQICNQTRQALCLEVLNSNPHSARADLKGLGRISIYTVQKHAKQTSVLIASLLKGAKNSKLKQQYNRCAKAYGGAIGDLNGAKKILKKKVLSPSDISAFRSRASAAFKGLVTCVDAFDYEIGPGEPSNQPPKLKQANDKFVELYGIVSDIGVNLKSG